MRSFQGRDILSLIRHFQQGAPADGAGSAEPVVSVSRAPAAAMATPLAGFAASSPQQVMSSGAEPLLRGA